MYFYSKLWIRQCSWQVFWDPSGERERWKPEDELFLFQCFILKCLLNKKYIQCIVWDSKTYTSTFSVERMKIHRVLKYLFEHTHTKLENCALWVCWMQVRINQLFLSGGHWGHSLADYVLKCFKHSIPGYHIVPELLLPQLLGWGIWWGQGMWKQKNYYMKERPVLKQPESASVL